MLGIAKNSGKTDSAGNVASSPFHLGDIRVSKQAWSTVQTMGEDHWNYLLRHASGEVDRPDSEKPLSDDIFDDDDNLRHSRFTLSNGQVLQIGTKPDHSFTLVFLADEVTQKMLRQSTPGNGWHSHESNLAVGERRRSGKAWGRIMTAAIVSLAACLTLLVG
jgi:hypothetical protein